MNKETIKLERCSSSSVAENSYTDSETSSESIRTTTTANSVDSSEISNILECIRLGDLIGSRDGENYANISNDLNFINNLCDISETNVAGGIHIENSENVHVGNITVVDGSVYRTKISYSNFQGKPLEQKIEKCMILSLKLIDRRTWLAQEPINPCQYIEGPVSLVIICHTATDLGRTQPENVYNVRFMQCLHIESQRMNDIMYNFLIGCDGNVYEGRGWGVVGNHTVNYNNKSLGIAFIGNFMNELPPKKSLNACKTLIETGIQLGYILPKYNLCCQSQYIKTDSPGKRLVNEIKTWRQFMQN